MQQIIIDPAKEYERYRQIQGFTDYDMSGLIPHEENKVINRPVLVLGMPGRGYHITIFSIDNFKPELAPSNAEIESLTNESGNQYIKMCY